MKAAKQSVPTYWHPTFRIERELPDTKVIRTSFAVNAVAIAVALASGAFLYSRESALSELRGQIQAENAKIEAAKPRVSKAQELQKQFSEGEKKIREIEAFVAPKLVASEFLITISETLPRLVTLDSIEMATDVIRLRGAVVGSSERSAPLANAYAEQLGSIPAFKEQMAAIKLNNQVRDQTNDRFTFEIELKLKSGAKSAGKK
ncbi:MAG TPA: hypothetical protein VK178_03675 [Opitutaceae bacterium]|nr:hypothetical protein [Opitutaceae bacterium]